MDDIVYHSLAEKPMQTSAPESSLEPYYPSVHLTADQFPELFAFDVSDGLEVSFKCKIVSKNESEHSSSLCLELRSGAVSGNSKGEYGDKETPAPIVIVLNEASEALAKLTGAKARRMG